MTLARLGFVLIMTLAAAWLLTHRQLIDIANIEPLLRALGTWAPIGFTAIYATGTILFFPGALLGIAGGALFGPVWGTLWNLLGATLGATIAFLLARGIAGEWVAQRRSIQPAQLRAWSHAHLAASVRPCIASLHAAGNYRLHLARLRRPLGCIG